MPENKEVRLQNEQENRPTTPEIVTTETRAKETPVIVDIRETTPRVPHEVKTWMQKIEEDPTQMKTVQDDSGQPVLVPTPNQNPKIVLPITRDKFVEGFKKSIDSAGHWLSAFLFKLIKKNKGNVKFKQE